MQCTKPIKITLKSGLRMDVPCGYCRSCRIARSREWATRLSQELESYPESVFVTLTYNDDNLPQDFSVHKEDLQRFFKRLRKRFSDRKIKYFACGEYGEKSCRPHYHAIIFGLGMQELEYYYPDKKNIASFVIEDLWPYGNNVLGTVTYDSCRYVCDYIQKAYLGKGADDYYIGMEKPFQLVSQGLGKEYALNNAEEIKRRLGMTLMGRSVGLPRYYKNKLDISDKDVRMAHYEKRVETNQYYEKKYDGDKGRILDAKIRSNEQKDKNIKARSGVYGRGEL